LNLSSKRNFIKTMRPLNTSVDLNIIQSELINNQDDDNNSDINLENKYNNNEINVNESENIPEDNNLINT